MIPEERQNQAISYLLAELSPVEQSTFESELQRDAELQAFVGEMRKLLGLLAQTAPLATPPAGLKDRIMAIAREDIDPVPVKKIKISPPNAGRVPVAWMAFSAVLFLAAMAAVLDDSNIRALYASQLEKTGSVKQELDALKQDLDSQRQQIASMEQEQANALSQIRVATLDPLIPPLSKASAVVIWNAGKQQGVIKGAHLSEAGPGKDYQLWLIDPSTPGPVSAGVIAVGQDGSFAIAFKPVHSVASVAKFAISVEASGGADSPHGPIVFVGG